MVNNSLGGYKLTTIDGKIGYYLESAGADSAVPFSSINSTFENIEGHTITANYDYKAIIISSYQDIATDITVNGVSVWSKQTDINRSHCVFHDGKAGDVINLVKSNYYDWDIITLIG